MDYLSQYIVPFHGLDGKEHNFDFVVNDEFFKHFEEGIIEGGEVKAQLTVVKKTSGLHLNLNLTGFVKIVCDRCLELYDQEIDFDDSIFVEFGEETDFDTNRDVVTLDKNTSEINISQFIYEFSNFALPFQHYHPDTADGQTGCNKEMLDLINKHLPKEEEEAIDPRWEKLKELKK